MKINRLVLDNFRSYEHLDLFFEKDITIISGDNGEGKTSVLDSIAQLFGRLTQQLPGSRGLSTRESDLRIIKNNEKAPGMRLWMEIDVRSEVGSLEAEEKVSNEISISRSRVRDQLPRTRAEFLRKYPPVGTVGTRQLDMLAGLLAEAEADEKRFLMPLVVYYGTNRAVFETPLRRRNFKTKFARSDSMSGSLEGNTNFKRVFEWFHSKEAEEVFEQRNRKDWNYRSLELEAVKKAIETAFPNFKNPRTMLRPLRFVVDKVQEDKKIITFDLNQLSDGYRTCLALVADLACRMAEANPAPNLDNALKTEAVVLIDEIDLHLHPRWQQNIMLSLAKVFPCSQFIVTTHSAQVLTTVEPRCIRKLKNANGEAIFEIPEFSLGARSNQLMEDVQEVELRPDLEITRKLKEYRELVSNDKYDTRRALALRSELNAWGGAHDPELKRLDVDIKIRRYRNGSKQ